MRVDREGRKRERWPPSGGLSCQPGGLTTTTTAAVDKDGIEGWCMLDYAFAT